MAANVMTGGERREDPVSNVLKWILLVVAVACFAVLGWTTVLTYQQAPPLPDRFVSPDGAPLMSAADITEGKAGFQRADLMDYGSIYGMGSYFGEDYTAANLIRLAQLTEENIATANPGKALADLTAEQRASVETAMRGELITDKAQVTNLYSRCAESYGVKRAERAMGLGFRDHQMPTRDQFAGAVDQLKLRAIRFTPAS